MTYTLKDQFESDVARRIAAGILSVHPVFPVDDFLADALDGYEALELTPRARQIAAVLRRHLPAEVEAALAILTASLGPPLPESDAPQGMAPFLYLPHVYFVAEHGLGCFDAAMRFQHALTQRFTAEFSIRVFLEREPERTLAVLRGWATEPSAHVRRLVSEGTRPRLPWAPRLRAFQADPRPVLDLLELLKDDPAEYVRRSVANNLNDIGKDHPDLLLATCRRWVEDAGTERRRLIRHALRTLVKAGDPEALALLGVRHGAEAAVEAARVMPASVPIGGSVTIAFAVVNTGAVRERFLVDYRVHYVKANGTTSPKVFKLRTLELNAGERVELRRTISTAQRTTRMHYPGLHQVEALVNGRAFPVGTFVLVPGTGEDEEAK